MSKHIITNNQQLEYILQCVKFCQQSEDFTPENHIDQYDNNLHILLSDLIEDTISCEDDDTVHMYVA
jgi:hypothetical protein